jgi:uncharacterized membrane-anchored protein YhcB (DUF1043 family)
MVVDAIISAIGSILGELGLFAIGATVVGWVARGAISNYFDKELSEYQAEIDKELAEYQSEMDKQMEQYRAELEKELDKYRTELEKEKLRFSELHNERAKVTAELYERFVKFEEDMRTLTDLMDRPGDPPKDEQMKNAAESGNEFVNYYMKKKIYFPPHVCETIEKLQSETKDVFVEFQVYKPYDDRPGDSIDAERWLDNWKTVTENEVPEIKEELEGHFRELLGVEIDQQSDNE